MNRIFFILSLVVVGSIFPQRLLADCRNSPGERITLRAGNAYHSMITIYDTVPIAKRADASNQEKPVVEGGLDNSVSVNSDKKETIIKAVPKSRRQSKPKIVNTNIEVKPIRVIKPKIIRKIGPLG